MEAHVTSCTRYAFGAVRTIYTGRVEWNDGRRDESRESRMLFTAEEARAFCRAQADEHRQVITQWYDVCE